MRQRFLPSGRAVFRPMTEYSTDNGSHRLTSLTTGETRSVRTQKLVDATHARTEIPSNSSAEVRRCAGHRPHPGKWIAKYLPAPFPIYRD